MNPFYQKIYALVAEIPQGTVASYGQLARMAGRPRAAREAGRALRICPGDLPWQRVIMADGSVAGGKYAEVRKSLLASEGIAFLPDGRVDMAAHQWQPRCAPPEESATDP